MPADGIWRGARGVEFALMSIILLAIAERMYFLLTAGYLGPPFFYDIYDTWMDWFNTAFWARESGTYDAWRSIYPPLSFVFLRLVGIDSCYAGPVEGRECDWLGIAVIHAIFVLNIFLVAKTFLKLDKKTALPRSIAVAAGMPMLYALERGNLLLICFTCLLLAFGPLLRSARLRWLFAGLAVNFKIYLVAAVLAQLLRRRWRWVEGALFATVAVYIVSFLIFGSGNPIEILENVTRFSDSFQAAQVLDIWYPNTYLPALSLLGGAQFPVTQVIGDQLANLGLFALPLITRAGQITLLFAAVAAWLRPEVVPPHRLALIGIAMALISTEVSGYTQITLILFVMMERWRGIARPIAIVSAYIICVPTDFYTIIDVPSTVKDSFLAGRSVEAQNSIGLGVFLRPGLTILIAIAMSAATIRDVWADIREQGWQSRWRYRRDAALLPGVARPHSP